MTFIVDEAWDRPTADELIKAGYVGLMAYISQDTTGKNITRAEIDAYHAKGLDVGLNYEYNPGSAKGGANAGDTDGAIAVNHARDLGAPKGTCLYFSVDWDVTDAEKPAVLAYANAARAHCLAAGYEAGIYGGYWVCLYLINNGYKGRLWQTFAWSGGNWLGNAVLRQIQNGVIVGKSNVDRNQVIIPDWGQWKSGSNSMTEPDYTPYGEPKRDIGGRSIKTMVADLYGQWFNGRSPWGTDPADPVKGLFARLDEIKAAIANQQPTSDVTQDMLNIAVANSAEAIGKAFAAEFVKHIQVQ